MTTMGLVIMASFTIRSIMGEVNKVIKGDNKAVAKVLLIIEVSNIDQISVLY